MEIIVLGGGVSGITTGLALRGVGQAIPELAFLTAPRQEHRVAIWADAFTDITSEVAGALWEPYLAGPAAKVAAWCATSYRCFQALQNIPASGVDARPVLDLSLTKLDVLPGWTAMVDHAQRVPASALPPGYQDGYTYASSVMDMGRDYLPYLRAAFQAAGGTFRQIPPLTPADLPHVFDQSDVVVNCTGLGSRDLFADPEVYPVRGQVVRIAPRPIIHAVVAERIPDGQPGAMAYVIPRRHDIVLGGTSEDHRAARAVDDAQIPGIIRRCQQIVPQLGEISPDDILSVACGLRPRRAEVRVEAVSSAPGRYLLHNYGHGGAGVTLSWGCAQEVVALVNALSHA